MSYINIKCYCFEACGKVLYSLKEKYFSAFFFPCAWELGFLHVIKKFLFTNTIQPPRF